MERRVVTKATKADLDKAARAAGAKKPGDHFVYDGALYRVTDHGMGPMIVSMKGAVDLAAIEQALREPDASMERRLAVIAAVAAEAAREKWGAGDEFKPIGSVVVEGKPYVLGQGKHPHSRNYSNHYIATSDHPSGRDDDYVGFDGHRFPWHVEISESNYMKESELSGDEVRKSCAVQVYVKVVSGERAIPRNKLVFGFGSRTAEYALQKLPALLNQLREHPGELYAGDLDEFPKLIGRKVYWRDQPGVVRLYFPDQGAVVIDPLPGKRFRTPAYRLDDRDDDDDVDDLDDEGSIKADLLDGNIWWFRRKD